MKYGLKVFIQHYKSKEHWYIKYLIWGIVIIVFSAILVHVFKELGCTPARKIFDFFDDWALVLSAAATFLLAFTAFWAIMDNRYGRKVDRKERLLNEIIKWSQDVAEAAFYRQIKNSHEIWSALLKYRHLEARSKYIEVIVKSDFIDLYESLQDISTKLGDLKEFTEKCANDKADKDRLKEYETILEQSVESLLKEAAKTKAKLLF
ncbi:MAG: hypothetical protein ABIK32_03545 [Chloroflexota bacterium]